jgi:osmotically-inducible protein OsmY
MVAMRTDVRIQHDVIEELKWDTRVDETDVGVEVDKGVVTLTGTVDNYAKRLAAREAAHRVGGVLDVADDIQVVVPGSARQTDTELAQAVRTALTSNVFVVAKHIRSTVTDGRVTLEGEVDNWSERSDAEQAVRNLRGVRGVLNNTTVASPTPRVDADAIRGAIEGALERRAEHETKGIQVRVEGGTVTLTGNVSCWAEEQAVLQAASHAPGVQHINNDLDIDLFA